jgi:carbonic anhydrase
MTDILQEIRSRQQQVQSPKAYKPAVHQPEMLYIGCIDARLDPIADIGIGKGKAIIHRNIAALVGAENSKPDGTLDPAVALATGQVPENVSIGATLEFFLNHVDSPSGVMKHIVVSGHTHCGGINACLENHVAHEHYLPKYLTAFDVMRDHVVANGGSKEKQLRELEKAAVRQSVQNLMTYEVVQKALAEKRVELHGWIIDTATGAIFELEPTSDTFIEMSKWQSVA